MCQGFIQSGRALGFPFPENSQVNINYCDKSTYVQRYALVYTCNWSSYQIIQLL